MINKTISTAIRSAIGLGVLTGSLSIGFAQAQDGEVSSLEEVIVTGSRITDPNVVSSSQIGQPFHSFLTTIFFKIRKLFMSTWLE